MPKTRATRPIYDSTGLYPVEEQMRVLVRRGAWRGRIAIVQYIRRSSQHIRIYVVVKGAPIQGTWLSPRSVEVLP
jgi:hypothetical protein